MSDHNGIVSAALVGCASYEKKVLRDCLIREFELLGGVEKYVCRGESVLLKPNLIAPKPANCAVQTDGRVIVEVARLLKDVGARPFVADSPAWSSSSHCIDMLGISEELDFLGVPVRELNRPVKRSIEPSGEKVYVSRVALDADKIINLPKLKAHQQMTVTIAIKNMFGCVCGKRKALWHYRRGGSHERFSQLLIGIYRLMSPVLTILDAVVSMEGMGPIRGNPRHTGFLLGSSDGVACERICCGLIGLEPGDIPILRTAEQMGYGVFDIDKIELLGDDPSGFVFSDFQIPKQIPLKFTLPRICKSISRQVLILAKSKFSGREG